MLCGEAGHQQHNCPTCTAHLKANGKGTGRSDKHRLNDMTVGEGEQQGEKMEASSSTNDMDVLRKAVLFTMSSHHYRP